MRSYDVLKSAQYLRSDILVFNIFSESQKIAIIDGKISKNDTRAYKGTSYAILLEKTGNNEEF